MKNFIICTFRYYYGDQMKEDGMSGACSKHREMRNSYKILVVKPEVKRPLGIPKRTWG
jgi:hypothetical protein